MPARGPHSNGSFTHTGLGTTGKNTRNVNGDHSLSPGLPEEVRCTNGGESARNAAALAVQGRGQREARQPGGQSCPGGGGGCPWLLPRGLTGLLQDNSQPASPSQAPGRWRAGGTAPTSPGPRPCPPAGRRTGAVGPAGAHSSRRSASCLQESDHRPWGSLALTEKKHCSHQNPLSPSGIVSRHTRAQGPGPQAAGYPGVCRGLQPSLRRHCPGVSAAHAQPRDAQDFRSKKGLQRWPRTPTPKSICYIHLGDVLNVPLPDRRHEPVPAT